MNNAYVDSVLAQCRLELAHVQTSIGALGFISDVSPYLTKYAVIRACGTIEVCFKTIIADFCSRKNKKQLKHYIERKVTQSSTNPSFENILNLLGQFDVSWKNSFKLRVDGEPDKVNLRSSLQSLVDARNEFAHGGNPTLTISDIINHFDNARRVLEHLDQVVA